MKIEELLIAMLVIAALMISVQYFAGGTFTSYNTTQNMGFMASYNNTSTIVSSTTSAYQELNKTAPPLSSWNVFTLPSLAWKSLKMMFIGLGEVTALPYTLVKTLQGQPNAPIPPNVALYVGIASMIIIIGIVSYFVAILLRRGSGGLGV